MTGAGGFFASPLRIIPPDEITAKKGYSREFLLNHECGQASDSVSKLPGKQLGHVLPAASTDHRSPQRR
jgi:hypothetical protein